jgi:steroid delta-isomerase-like uncharacterized protein
MITDKAKQWSDQLFAAWNSHDVKRLLDLYDDDFIREDIGNHKLYSKEQLAKTFQAYITAFPDIQFTAEKLLGCEEQITICWRATGHHRGSIMNIPPTGKYINLTGVSVIELKNEKAYRIWYQWDQASMLRQMGLLPELRHAV